MGNNQSTNKQSSEFPKTAQQNKNTSRIDDFMIKYHQINKITTSMTDETCLEKRVVFVSLISAFNTWRSMPSHVLYAAIFLVPLCSEWVYKPQQYIMEIKDSLLCSTNIFIDIADTALFIEMLKWKDKQGLVFWMLNYKHKCNSKASVHPFWIAFNHKITHLYNPVTRGRYNKLNLDEQKWKNKTPKGNFYCKKTTLILGELNFLLMKYKCIQEIIFQSNPKSLIPIKAYNMQCNIFSNKRYELYQEFDDNNNMEDWFISMDYDPFELD